MSVRIWLLFCGALGAGEYAAASLPQYAAIWPALLAITLLAALFGFALAFRGWAVLGLGLLGLTLGFRTVVVEGERYRDSPWLRGRISRNEASAAGRILPVRSMRETLSHRLAIGLEPHSQTLALNRAILLGERSHLPFQTRKLFVDSGTMHVFAISGLHVMAVASVLGWLMRLGGGISRRWAALVSLPVLWGYVAVIGSPPSAVRAAMMASLGALAPVFWRRPNGLIAWAETFLSVHLFQPEMIVNVGSVLSFGVMLAILLTGELVRDWEPIPKGLLVTLTAWMAGVPIAAHVFGRVTPGGLLANLVLIGTARWTVYAGTLGVVVSLVSETLAAHFNGLAGLATEAMVMVADCVSRLPGANFEVPRWPVWAGLAWYAVALGLIFFIRWLCRIRRGIWYNCQK